MMENIFNIFKYKKFTVIVFKVAHLTLVSFRYLLENISRM